MKYSTMNKQELIDHLSALDRQHEKVVDALTAIVAHESHLINPTRVEIARAAIESSSRLPQVMNDRRDLMRTALRYVADLNGSSWIKGDGPGEVDMRNRAKGLQGALFNHLNGTDQT